MRNSVLKIKTAILGLLNKPHQIFLILAIPFGLFAIYAVPPLAGNDELSHVARAYEISDGRVFTQKTSTGNFGGEIPVAMLDLYQSNSIPEVAKIDRHNLDKFKNIASNVSINSIDKTEISYSGAALYSPISYVVHALAISFGKLCNLSVLNTIYLVRLSVFTVCVVLSFLAIKIAPVKKWFFLVVATLPMSILLAGNITLDGLLISSSLLFVSYILYIKSSKKRAFTVLGKQLHALIPLIPLSIYIALAKPVYTPLLLLAVLAINTLYRKYARDWFIWVAVTIVLPVLFMLAWNLAVTIQDVQAGQRLSVNSIGIEPPTTGEAIHEFISHPKTPAKLAFHTYYDHLSAEQDIPNYVTSSFFGKFTEYRITPALWFNISVALTLLLGFCLREKRTTSFSRLTRSYVLASFVVSIVAISLSMYLYATSFGQTVINGVQGRYFLPLLPFLVFLLSKRRYLLFENTTHTKVILLLFMILNLFTMTYLLAISFI